MAEFVYKSRIYGPRTFTVDDAGGIVTYKGQQLNDFGGYLAPGSRQRPLLADARTLEEQARRWWKLRVGRLDTFGRQANGVDP